MSVIELLKARGLTLSTAESCTGGMVGSALTDIAGASSVYMGGVVAYDNAVKQDILNVPVDILQQYGAVSHQTACAMAVGVQRLLKTDLAISTTGIAGPSGGSADKPVGLVYIGFSDENGTQAYEHHFIGDRTQIRLQTVDMCIDVIQSSIQL